MDCCISTKWVSRTEEIGKSYVIIYLSEGKARTVQMCGSSDVICLFAIEERKRGKMDETDY